jgi:uracil-DNA glycosylase
MGGQRARRDVLGPGLVRRAHVPVHDRIRAMGDVPACRAGCRPTVPPRRRADLRRVPAALRRRPRPRRGSGPLPDAGPRHRARVLRRSRRSPLPAQPAEHLPQYQQDLGLPPPTSGDLTPWVEQGVLLLNRSLTVAPGAPASHRGKGWEEVTEAAIDALVRRGGPLVAILWGRDARALATRLGAVPRVESAHPSPMSADRGFFGSRPFSRANRAPRRARRFAGRLAAPLSVPGALPGRTAPPLGHCPAGC